MPNGKAFHCRYLPRQQKPQRSAALGASSNVQYAELRSAVIRYPPGSHI